MDAGCGEGSHLSRLSRRINSALKCGLFGIDIAKEGLKIASKNDEDIVWVVADLAKLPFRDGSFQIILNILSPANYLEFERVLAPEGIVVKVIPEKSYLEELRTLIYKNNSYSNDKVIDYFSNKLELVSKQNIRYQFSVDEDILPHLIKMTPLTWGGSVTETDISRMELPSVTVDLTIVIGKKKR
ncbi:MAG TPA: methyltransferase domain-containing protein [Bacillota bacterium]|nr:methyltransferase domain-containing protein [Bacillota bacterium]